jgi:hypothetical protein
MGLLATLALLMLLAAGTAAADPVRAAYFYHYMDPDHLDSLAVRRFNRAVIHWTTDSLGARGATELAALMGRGAAGGIEIVPKWLLQNAARLASRPRERRYTWGPGRVETEVPCPLDSLYWRSALLDRAREFLAADGRIAHLAVDLELYRAGRHHYDGGPCRCGWCRALYLAGRPAPDAARLWGLLGFQEGRLERLLAGLLEELKAEWPEGELGVLDLDYDSFVHRALGRALARAGMATSDYCERSYPGDASALAAARVALDALGLERAPLIGGLWLKRIAARELPAAARAVLAAADGYFVFTTYSLWLDPERLAGPYTLPGAPAEYWRALAEINQP